MGKEHPEDAAIFRCRCYVLVAQWKVELLYRPHSLQLKSLQLLINEGFNCEVVFLLLEARCYCLWLEDQTV